MLTCDLNSWKKFIEKYEMLVDWREKKIRQSDVPFVSYFLFRGQANAKWCLRTTLERYTQRTDWKLSEYFRLTHGTKAQIETYTGKSWNEVPKPDEYDARIKKTCVPANPATDLLQCYDYMVYLRHHGFGNYTFNEPVPICSIFATGRRVTHI
jgi:hypothetical protein